MYKVRYDKNHTYIGKRHSLKDFRVILIGLHISIIKWNTREIDGVF